MCIIPTTAKEIAKHMAYELDNPQRQVRTKDHYVLLTEHERHEGYSRFAERTIFLDVEFDVIDELSK